MHKPALPSWLVDSFSPLSLAAYVAWTVVWITVRSAIGERQPEMLGYVSVALVVFLIAFVLTARSQHQARQPALIALHLLMAASALLLIYLWPFGTGQILLVLFAATLAAHFPLRQLVLWLLLTNLCVLVFMYYRSGAGVQGVLLSVLAYSSFQAFATSVIRNMRAAEQMADDLRATNAELMTTRLLLAESVRDSERLRMSRELHDVAGHGLTALKLNLGVLARDSNQPDPERIGVCGQLADELLQNLRRVVQQLRAEPGPDLDAALRRIALPFPRPQLQLSIERPLPDLSLAQAEAVMRAVQEALTNAARHGNAQHLRVRVCVKNNGLALQIEDDGRVAAPVRPGGGLSGMRERFEELGGSLEIDQTGSGGLRLLGQFPLQHQGAHP
ncbi:MAG: sensor histidine kinase [Xanthomonadales bacterium]|nr:sensor histidine kinase [Xanthomonadales bacterium]